MADQIQQVLTEQNIKNIYDKRFVDTMFGSLGRECEVQLQSGEKGTGLFYTMHPKHGGVVINNYVKIELEDNNKEKQSQQPVQKIIKQEELVYILIKDFQDPPYVKEVGQKVTNKIKTDRDLGKKDDKKKRVFQSFNLDEHDEEEDIGDLEGGADKNYKAQGDFNQFEVNEKQFGIQVKYDEHKYTSKLDMKDVSKELQKKAEQAEKELLNEKGGAANRHILEDRGLAQYGENEDEEAIYSAVLQSGRYENQKKLDQTPSQNQKSQNKPIQRASQPASDKNKKTETKQNTNKEEEEKQKPAKPVENTEKQEKKQVVEEQKKEQEQEKVEEIKSSNLSENNNLDLQKQSSTTSSKKQMAVNAKDFNFDVYLEQPNFLSPNNSTENNNNAENNSLKLKPKKEKQMKIGSTDFSVNVDENKEKDKIFNELLLENISKQNCEWNINDYSTSWQENETKLAPKLKKKKSQK